MIGANAHLYIPLVITRTLPIFPVGVASDADFFTFSAPLAILGVVYSVGVPPANSTGIRCTWSFTLSVCKSFIDVQVFVFRYQSLLSKTR